MSELVVAGPTITDRARDEDLAAYRIPETVEQVALGQPCDMREEGMVDPSARDCGHADRRLGGLGQGDDPGQQDLAQGRRQAATLGVTPGAEQFLDEKRVAIGAAVDLFDEVG